MGGAATGAATLGRSAGTDPMTHTDMTDIDAVLLPAQWAASLKGAGVALPNASIYADSLEQVPAFVTPPTGINPTGDTVQMAFLATPPPAQPSSEDWLAATWQSTSPPYVALCLVGPGGTTTLAQGQWYVWLQLTASPEVPVKYCGLLQVS
jgi:hypothetical protein